MNQEEEGADDDKLQNEEGDENEKEEGADDDKLQKRRVVEEEEGTDDDKLTASAG